MARKIYINTTYRTKFDTEFTVVKVIKGKSAKSTDRRANQTRRAVNEEGCYVKITNLLEVIG
jgi:hypothetical protein